MTETTRTRPRTSGPGRTLIVFYFIMTLAALARSIVEILTKFSLAPVSITLSFLAGVVYLVATIALVRPGRRAYRVAYATIVIELLGVLTIGLVSLLVPGLFPLPFTRHPQPSTVWAYFGLEYLLLPLVLPVLGLLFLRTQRSVFQERP